MHVSYHFWAFFWLALRTLTFGGFYMNYNMEAKSLTFRRGSEVSQVLVFPGYKRQSHGSISNHSRIQALKLRPRRTSVRLYPDSIELPFRVPSYDVFLQVTSPANGWLLGVKVHPHP